MDPGAYIKGVTDRFEGAPSGLAESGENSFAAESFTVPEPAVESRWEVPKRASSAERQAVEQHNMPIERRAALVEEMMDKGTGGEQYKKLWDDISERLTQGRRQGETKLSRYLAEAENVREVTALVKELRGGMAWNDVLAREGHELSDDSVSERRLRALEVVSLVMNSSVREWKQPDGSVDRRRWENLAGNMQAQALLRVSEIVNLEAKGARLRHGVLSEAERQYSGEYVHKLEALGTSRDVPEVFRERARDTVHAGRMQQVGGGEPAAAPALGEAEPSVAARPAPGGIKSEASPRAQADVVAGMASPQVEQVSSAAAQESLSVGADVPETEPPPAENLAAQPASETLSGQPVQPEIEVKPELKSREAVFGREGISREDLRGIRGQIAEQLNRETPEAALAAARQLAHLKRARIELSAEGKGRLFERLLKHREAFGEREAMEQARYLTYLKYLGALDQVSAAERQRLELAIVERTANNKLADLDRLCLNAKYLGVRRDFSSVRSYLERDMARRLVRPDGEEGVAFARARRKYLDLPHGLSDEHLRVEDRIDRRLRQYGQRGQWDRFARLRVAVDYVRGSAPVEEPVQRAVAEHVSVQRAQAREHGDWRAHTAYVADAAMLARQATAAEGEPAVRRAADSDVAQFLAGLELRGDLKSDEERLREILAERERAERPRRVRETARQRQPKPAAEQRREMPVDAEARPQQAASEAAGREHLGEAGDQVSLGEERGVWARLRRWWRGRFGGGGEPRSGADTESAEPEEPRRAA